jgi:opacity protein-like surface antigen
MDLSRHYRLIAAASLCALCISSAVADDCISPVKLGDKPAMTAYGDYSDFLVAVMEHKALEEKKRKHQKLCPELYREAPTAAAKAESLDAAIQASSQQPPFDYRANASWYNRSTSQSFGLPSMPNAIMAGTSLGTSFTTLDDGAVNDALAASILAMLGAGNDIEDARFASDFLSVMFERTLAQREDDVDLAFRSGDFLSQLTSIDVSGNGGLTLYLGGAGFLKIDASIETESCLSSCGEFQMTIGVQ